MNIKATRVSIQVLGLVLHNLGLTFSLKTGIVTPALYCYACPLAMFACPIGTLQHFCALRILPLYAIGSLGFLLTAAGRSFCGWICPFGSLHDALGLVRSRWKKTALVKLKACSAAKFIMLLAVLAVAWYAADTIYCRFCPSASLFASIPYFILNPTSGVPFYFVMHMLTLVVVLVLALVVGRFWCRYLCPMGALNGVFNRFSILKITRSESECTGCGSCVEKCPMGIGDLSAIGKSSDCILCGRCVEACTKHALRFAT